MYKTLKLLTKEPFKHSNKLNQKKEMLSSLIYSTAYTGLQKQGFTRLVTIVDDLQSSKLLISI